MTASLCWPATPSRLFAVSARGIAFGETLMSATDELFAPDDRTIRFRLKRPFPLLPNALGKPSTMPCIMPERLARTDPGKQVTEMVGSGPYRFLPDERIAGSSVAYRRFEGYQPRADGVASFTAGPEAGAFRPGGMAGHPRRLNQGERADQR